MRSTISNLAHLPYHKQSVSPEKSGKSEYKKTLSPASFPTRSFTSVQSR